jgi:hypothetical protein
MATEPAGSQQGKSLEMRVAAIEDKLAKLHISEEEMKTYEKVASLLGGGGTTPALSPQLCQCVVSRVRSVFCQCIIRPIINTECICGPCNCQAGGGFGGLGGGFSTFGS